MNMRAEGSISNRDAQRLIKKTLGDKGYGKFVKPDYDNDTSYFDMRKFRSALAGAASGDSGDPKAEIVQEKAWEAERAAPRNPATGNVSHVSEQMKHLDKTVGEPSKQTYPYNQRPTQGFKERDPGRSDRVYYLDPLLDPSQTPQKGLPPRTFDGGYQTLRGVEKPYDKSVEKKKKGKGAGKPKGLLLDDEQKKGLIY